MVVAVAVVFVIVSCEAVKRLRAARRAGGRSTNRSTGGVSLSAIATRGRQVGRMGGLG